MHITAHGVSHIGSTDSHPGIASYSCKTTIQWRFVSEFLLSFSSSLLSNICNLVVAASQILAAAQGCFFLSPAARSHKSASFLMSCNDLGQCTPEINTFPAENERSEPSAKTNGQQDESVIIHSQQHNEIRHSELEHMECGSRCLLFHVWSEWRLSRNGQRRLITAPTGKQTFRFAAGSSWARKLMLPKEVVIVYFCHSAEEFEGHDEEDHTQA